jgi:hypothetical protein
MRLFISWIIALMFIAQAHGQQTIKVGIVGDADNHQVNWTTEIGYNYLVEVSPDLVAWTDTGIVQAGTGAVVTYGFSTPTEPKLFYRIRVRPGAVRPGFNAFEIPANDDGSADPDEDGIPDLIPIGFPINLFGTTWNDCYINNNGNITFEAPKIDYVPDPLRALGFPIIAPFWADVDTRASGSDIVRYSNGVETIDGHPAFGVNWVKVGYFNQYDDKLNSFQLVLINRSDTGTGNFDIEFNYDIILWETGNASGGSNGYGGSPSRSGLSNGSNQDIELQYSAETLKQLDSNPLTEVPNFITGLIYRSRNSTVPGRFVFQVRSGQVLGALNVYAGPDQPLDPSATSTVLAGTASNPLGGAVSVMWSVVQGPPGVTFSNPAILNPTVSFPADEYGIILKLTATSVADPTIKATDTMTINP